ncbi:MAG TPA: hypothetical protein VL634_19360, partial [Mycobacterium sp.]|nr:hypothetical protein [Mycobacterium sp.]
NRRAIPATTPNWVNTDRRRGAAFAPGDAVPYVRAAWDVAPDINIYVETVHRLGNVGAVVTYAATGTSGEGFHAEWREIAVLMFEGELISRCEIFDDTDLDTALATFDEFNAAAPQFGNAAIRTWTQIVEAINRRDASGFHALSSADGRLADRRKGLRAWHEGTERRKAAESMCRAPASWRMEVEPVAVRGDRFGLTRERWRDTDEADSPITVESLTLTEATDDGLVYYTVVFDPDDINGAFAELTARWIASGEVAHPEVIETQLRVVQAVNNHDWDTYTALCGGASGINHRQLGIGDTFADFTASLQTMVSLAPNLWVELSEILACSALGVVSSFAIRGTLTHGSEVEIPAVLLYLMDGDHVKWIESFDGNQRDLALARFEELSRA